MSGERGLIGRADDMLRQWLRPASAGRPRGAQPAAPMRVRLEPTLLPPGEAFTPTQPKPGRRQITGRQAELDRILQALREEHAHVVLYTERGRGKTSLSNLVIETLRQGGVIVARYTCEAGSSFDSVIRGLLRDLPRSLLAIAANDPGEIGCEAALPPGELRPRDVAAAMSRLTCRNLVCVIDEFDRIEDAGTRTRLADTIKQLSDQAVPLLFMIVGVSENLEQILGQHPSIQRNLVALHLPLLTDEEIASMIGKGAREAGFSLFPGAVEWITALARGAPHMAQLFGLRLIQAASRRGDAQVLEIDFEAALAQLLAEAPPSALALYASLLPGESGLKMVRALRALAGAAQDPWGRIAVLPSFRDGMAVGESYMRAEEWRRILDAGVLRPAVGAYGMYVFADRGFMQLVLLIDAQVSAPEAAPQDRVGASLHRLASDH